MKISTDKKYLEKLIDEGEHQEQDFKFEISSAKKIAKSLSAFSNSNGGRLLIGIKDNGKIAGAHVHEELYMIEAAADLYSKPKVKYEVQEFLIEGKEILLISIPQAKNKPIYAKGENGRYWAYIRIDDENILADKVHLEVWKHASKPKGEFVSFTHEEQLLIDTLKLGGKLTINQIGKLTKLKRNKVIKLLTKFILFEIIVSEFKNRSFLYKLA